MALFISYRRGAPSSLGLPVKHRKADFKLPDGNVVQKIIFVVDGEIAKTWLSKQLGVEEASIIFGSIEV